METTLGIFKGLLGPLPHDGTAYSDGTAGFKPPFEGRNAFFKVYTGLNHEDSDHAGGDLPDARCKQPWETIFFPSTSNMYRVCHPSVFPASKSTGFR